MLLRTLIFLTLSYFSIKWTYGQLWISFPFVVLFVCDIWNRKVTSNICRDTGVQEPFVKDLTFLIDNQIWNWIERTVTETMEVQNHVILASPRSPEYLEYLRDQAVKNQIKIASKQSSLSPSKQFRENANFIEKESRVRLISSFYVWNVIQHSFNLGLQSGWRVVQWHS